MSTYVERQRAAIHVTAVPDPAVPCRLNEARSSGHRHHPYFQRTVIAVIAVNFIAAGWGLLDHPRREFTEAIELTCLVFFAIEIGVRLHQVDWNLRRFLREPWNVFDSVVVLLAIVPAVFGVNLAWLRIARLARVLHLLRHTSHLRAVSVIARRKGRDQATV